MTNDTPGHITLEHEGWPWRPDLCPADEELIEYLEFENQGGPMFHMGTGLHHKVGDWATEHKIKCYGLTASREEFHSASGHISPYYSVILQNLYTMAPEAIPPVDIMTFFHIGEMEDQYPFDGEAIKELIIQRLQGNGIVLFYNGSSAWDRIQPFVKSLRDIIGPYAVYKHLEAYYL